MILLLDNKEQLVKVINDTDVFDNYELIRLTDENYVSYMLTVETSFLPKNITDQVSYVMVGKDTDYQAYFISKIQTRNDRTIIVGVSALIEQLRKTIVPAISGTMRLSQALLIATRDTDIIVNMDTETIHREIFIDLHFESAWDAIKELSYYYGFEIDFNVKYTGGNEQTDPYEKRMIVRDPVGAVKPGVAVVYGYNAKMFDKDTDRSEIVTALYGFGKPVTETQQYKSWQRDTREKLREAYGTDWEKHMPYPGFDPDNPPNVDMSTVSASDKPLGQIFYAVPDDSAELRMLGIWDRESQSYKHRYGKIKLQASEDPLEIYQATKNELRKRIVEDVYYKVVVDDLDVNVGDVVRIGTTYVDVEDSDFDKARVIELTRDNLLDKNRDVRIGEHITPSRNRERRENRTDQPLITNPAISSFGLPGDRGLIAGIDDIIDGSWIEREDIVIPDPPDVPEVPDLPDPPKVPDWTENNPNHPGVIAEFVVVVPNTIEELVIQNIGAQAVNYNDVIDEWSDLRAHNGDIVKPGPNVPISNFQGVATEKKTYYRIDGSVSISPTIHYIIGKPNDIIRDLITDAKRIELGIAADSAVLDQTIEELYDGEYGLPEPDAVPYVFDNVNNLNILGENLVIVPANNTLTYEAIGSISSSAIDFSNYSDDTHLVTSVYNYTDVRDIATSGTDEVYVGSVRFTLHHRYEGEIGTTSVVVIYGPPALPAIQANAYMDRWVGASREPYLTYYKGSLIPNSLTIADIYDELAKTYEK